ncbi:hypothetical protein Aperf_G00000125567 [Anoplocephala perfoliata]
MSNTSAQSFVTESNLAEEDDRKAVFNSHSFQAFVPQLDHWERRIIRCIFEDNVESFITSCAETSFFIEKDILVDNIQHLASYRAMKFPDFLHQASIMHIVALFSAHRILQYLLDEFPPSKIWSTTKEGINAIHTSSAVGDYLALRMLLGRKDAPINNQDKLKRTALHYAAETNLESVITLLSINKKLLECVDTDELTPLQFIRYENRPSIQRFLKIHSELYSDTAELDAAGNKEAVNLRRLIEVPLILDSYVCVYLPQRQDSICENCNTRGNNHEKLSENDDFMRVMTSREHGFVRRPTNTFGQFEKSFSPVVSQYIRLTESTTMEKLEALLFELWQMPKPGLVLSFYGTDPFSPSLQKLLQKSLGRITGQTRTWILTDGREKCTGDVVSKAVKAYAEAYGMQQLQVIGLVPWRRLYNSQVLQCNDYLGREQMEFPKKPPGHDTRVQLAENHTHYIFIDSKENLQDLPLCRAQFEAFIAHLNDHRHGVSELYGDMVHDASEYSHRGELGIPKRLNSKFRPAQGSRTNRIPMCAVLVEGDRSNLISISYALQQNIPFVVISDTGGLAKALEIFVKFMKQLIQEELNEAFSLNLIERVKGVTEFEPNDKKYLAEILERAYLLEFVTSSATEMDSRILQSLVKPELFQGIDEEESWNFKIRIALSLNRIDILPEDMFARVHWKDKKGMKELVTKCLMGNYSEFVRLLVDSGFPLQEYIDDSLLTKLYKADFESNDPRVQLFRNYVYTFTPVPQIFRWSQMGQIVGRILGFQPGIRMPETKSRALSNANIDELLGASSSTGEESLLQLLVWSFLCRRFDLSHLIWTLMKDSIPAALMLACFARKMRTQQQSQREVAELDKMAEFYERSAVGILEECHITNSETTLTMLCTKRPLYGNLSQLLLAEESQSQNFIEHQACQTCIDNMWKQHLSANVKPISTDEKNKIPLKPTYKSRFLDFYRAPCVRFAYSAIASVLLLCLYFFILLAVTPQPTINPWEIALHVFSALLIIQHIVAAIENSKSVKQYFSSTWNQVVLLTAFFYAFGSLHYVDPRVRGFEILAVISRLFLCLCLLCACTFTLRFLVVSRRIGPKLMMIIEMMKRDMLPFLAIICVFWLTFSLFTVAMLFKPTGQVDVEYHGLNVFVIVRNCFFSMFGEFDMAENVNAIAKFEENCVRLGDCVYAGATYIYPIIMIVYVLLTHVLLLNLLIAMFTKRYSRMEIMSEQLWAMQKFGLVKSFATAPPLPFPYVIVWPFYSAFKLMYRICQRKPPADTPFLGYEIDETRQRQIMNWQKFRSLDYLHRHPNAYKQMRAQTQRGKGGKKDWWIESDAKEESHEAQISAISTKLATEYIEARLVGLELRLALAKSVATSSSAEVLSKDSPVGALMYQEEPKIATLEEDGKVVSRSQSKRFSTFRMSKITGAEPEKMSVRQFTYDNHKVVYFSSPGDDVIPHSLTRFIPWTEELPNYEPKVLDNAEEITPNWGAEEMEETITRGRKTRLVLRNPTGRTGAAGRGLLPSYGSNSAVVVVLILEEELWDKARKDNVVRRILLRSCPRRKHQLPWFIYKHDSVCDKLELASDASRVHPNQSLIYRLTAEELDKCTLRLCHLGELEDWINCDNAWIDITAICVRVTTTFRYWDIIPELFLTISSTAEWHEISKLPPVKSSHFRCLAYFIEAYLRNRPQTQI